jgi:hypothetical protein
MQICYMFERSFVLEVIMGKQTPTPGGGLNLKSLMSHIIFFWSKVILIPQ